MTIVSPMVGRLLTEVADTGDIDTALHWVLGDYLDLKINALRAQIATFESKWGMDFASFDEARVAEGARDDSYAYSVESDLWDWEAAVTLLGHYEDLRQQWT